MATLGPTAAPIPCLIPVTVDIPIRPKDHAFGWPYSTLFIARSSHPAARAEPHCTFPLIHPFQRTLSQLPSPSPSPSPRLNGGKGYKVSPQRPIQSAIYSGNLTPAAVSAPASDHYRVVREKGSEEKAEQGLRARGGLPIDYGSQSGFRGPHGVLEGAPEGLCTQHNGKF